MSEQTLSTNDFVWDDYKRIRQICLSDTMMSPPSAFSKKTAEKWQNEIQQQLKEIAGMETLYVLKPEGGLIMGPFDVDMHYERSSETLNIKAQSTEGEMACEVDAGAIRECVEEYRERFFSHHFKMAAGAGGHNPTLIEAMDYARSWQHFIGANTVIDSFNNSSVRIGNAELGKKIFSLLQITMPMDPETTRNVKEFYEIFTP